MSLLALILLAAFSTLRAHTCVNVTFLSGPGTNRTYRNAVSPNGVTYINYQYLDDESVSIQGHTFAPTSEGFIMKLDKDNKYQWIQRFGENSNNYLGINSIITDEDDNCFIHATIHGTTVFAGYTFSTQTPEWDFLNEVVIKLNASGDLEWVTHFSGGNDMIDDGYGHLFLHTTLGSINDYIFKEHNSDTTHVAKRDGVQNAVFSLNKSNGRVGSFTKLRTFIGTINSDHNQIANCSLYRVNNQVYISAFYTEGGFKTSKIFTCSMLGEIEFQKKLDGEVYSLFGSPVDNSYLYCHILLPDGKYNTRKYSTNFSVVIDQSENTNSPIFSLAYDNTPNYFIDNNGDITVIVNPSIPNYFTYNGEKVYENNTQRYAFMQFTPDLKLINFKTVIPGWGQEVYANLYFLPDSNIFKLIGYGSMANQIDTVFYAPDGYKSDVYVFDFLNDANIIHPEIILTHVVLDLDLNNSYRLNYTIPDGSGDEIVEWSSLDPTIASVDSSGLVSGVRLGETTVITAVVATGMADSCLVKVNEPYSPEIVMSDTLLDLEVEETYQFSYTIEKANGDETVMWFSPDSHIVSVSENGFITALSVGEAQVTAQILGTNFTETCTVTVSPITSVAKVQKSSIRIFPNPIANYVDFDANAQITKVEVYNLAGKKVMETRKAGRIDVSNLSMGMYFFKVSSNNQQFTYKMLKK